jgi:hypothetical protein
MKMSDLLELYQLRTRRSYNVPNGKRVGRSAFIKILDAGRTEANEPHRVIISRANIDEINEQILPLMMCL